MRMQAREIADEDVVAQLPDSLRTLMTLERFHLHKAEMFQNRSRDPGFDTRYFPQHCAAFQLPCFWIHRRHLYAYGHRGEADDEFTRLAGEGSHERVLFPIHPSSLDRYRPFLYDAAAQSAADEGLRVWAIPTSSTRTLLAWPDRKPEKALFVKTTLHSDIFGDRRMQRSKVGRSVGLSRLMQDCRASLPSALEFFPESAGVVPRQMPDSGAVIRSIPEDIKAGRVQVAPLFSLLGGSGKHTPLLLTILQRNDIPALMFVEEMLCAAFAKLWLEMSLRHGLILESHGQDILLALSPDLVPLGRFYYRDFEGLQVDWELRRRQGLPPPHDMPHDWSWRETYATWGYRYSEFAWYKLRISLFTYLHLVLNETELSLQDWHARGLIHCPNVRTGDIAAMFSTRLREAVKAQFGVSVECDVNRALNRFVISLLKIRREIMGTWRSPLSGFRPLRPEAEGKSRAFD